MSRPVISVRRVSADEERSFTELWMTSRVEAGVSPEVVARAASEGRISTALHREDAVQPWHRIESVLTQYVTAVEQRQRQELTRESC